MHWCYLNQFENMFKVFLYCFGKTVHHSVYFVGWRYSENLSTELTTAILRRNEENNKERKTKKCACRRWMHSKPVFTMVVCFLCHGNYTYIYFLNGEWMVPCFIYCLGPFYAFVNVDLRFVIRLKWEKKKKWIKTWFDSICKSQLA